MSKLIENIIQWFLPKCPSCNTGHLHIVDEDRGKNIYECDRCNKEFI